MGHSDKAFRQGVTARYVGSPSVDLWSSRLNSNYEDKLGLDTSASTPLKRKRLTPEEITRYCEENDLDARSKGVRDKAGKWIQKTYRDDQIAKAQNGSSPKRSSRGQLTYHIPSHVHCPCRSDLLKKYFRNKPPARSTAALVRWQATHLPSKTSQLTLRSSRTAKICVILLMILPLWNVQWKKPGSRIYTAAPRSKKNFCQWHLLILSRNSRPTMLSETRPYFKPNSCQRRQSVTHMVVTARMKSHCSRSRALTLSSGAASSRPTLRVSEAIRLSVRLFPTRRLRI